MKTLLIIFIACVALVSCKKTEVEPDFKYHLVGNYPDSVAIDWIDFENQDQIDRMNSDKTFTAIVHFRESKPEYFEINNVRFKFTLNYSDDLTVKLEKGPKITYQGHVMSFKK